MYRQPNPRRGVAWQPLAWAVVAWRNSLVFHSLDRVTSVLIHFLPALYMYTVRWYGAGADNDTNPCASTGLCEPGWAFYLGVRLGAVMLVFLQISSP